MSGGSAARTSVAVVSLVAFSGAMTVLHGLGHGVLAAPPIESISATGRWAADRDPAVIAMVLVRMLSLGVGYHLLATTLLSIVGRVLRAPRLVTLADAMTLPMFRSTAGRLAGLAISASAVVGGGLPSASASPTPVAGLDAPAPGGGGTGPVLIQRIALPPDATGFPDPSSATLRAVATPTVPAAAPAPTLHRVQPGDHLWGIAERALGEALGRPATDAEVDPFWRQVILANPDLVDPDLIFPGQLVVVPPVPHPPG